jgi:mono/diheme cytochrome c family protein
MCRTSVPPDSRAAQQLFVTEVKPIFQQHCLRCHGGGDAHRLDLSNRAAAFLPHPSGRAYIVPGQPDESLLIEAVSRDGLHQRMMPRLQVTLTDMEIGTLREWIEAGAPWPTGPAGDLHHVATREHP